MESREYSWENFMINPDWCEKVPSSRGYKFDGRKGRFRPSHFLHVWPSVFSSCPRIPGPILYRIDMSHIPVTRHMAVIAYKDAAVAGRQDVLPTSPQLRDPERVMPGVIPTRQWLIYQLAVYVASQRVEIWNRMLDHHSRLIFGSIPHAVWVAITSMFAIGTAQDILNSALWLSPELEVATDWLLSRDLEVYLPALWACEVTEKEHPVCIMRHIKGISFPQKKNDKTK